jgi:sulfur-oxidizing protein SoxY
MQNLSSKGWNSMNRANCHAASKALALFVVAAGLLSPTHSDAADDAWSSIKADVFGTRSIIDNDGVVALEAPVRAEDAAFVPISMKVMPAIGESIRSLTLIIDNNPSPVAVKFTFGPAAGAKGTEQHIATRIRVDSYTFVRAIAETSDGKLHMAAKFVKASGGCSAPAPKDMDTAMKGIGKIRIKDAKEPSKYSIHEVQVMLKHPNINGLQLDPVTRSYTPPKFIKQMTIKYGGDVVLDMESGISISADPNFRISYKYSGPKPFAVRAIDTDESVFTAEAELPAS